jgi:hypothetical protein
VLPAEQACRRGELAETPRLVIELDRAVGAATESLRHWLAGQAAKARNVSA